MCILGYDCHFYFNLKMGGGGGGGGTPAHCPPSHPPPPGLSTDKQYFVKLAVSVSSGGRNCCDYEFFLPALVLSGICLFIF